MLLFVVGSPANKLGLVKVTGVGLVSVCVTVGVLFTTGDTDCVLLGDPWYKMESVVFILGFCLKSFVNLYFIT